MTEREVRNNNYVVHNGENGDVDHTQKGKNPPVIVIIQENRDSFTEIKASAEVSKGPWRIPKNLQVSLPAAFRSISAMSLASSLVLAGPCPPSLVMSGTAFLRPVRSQLMKSEYDASTSIICP